MDQQDTFATPADLAAVRIAATQWLWYTAWLARELRDPLVSAQTIERAADHLDALVSDVCQEKA